MKIFLRTTGLLCLALFTSITVNAQLVTIATSPLPASQKCFSDQMKTLWQLQHPELKEKENKLNEDIYNYLNSANRTGNNLVNGGTISVVVHIVHTNGPENISDAQVIQGIQDLNDAFANTGAFASPTGINTGIQFCLANQDPLNNPTTGITRSYNIFTNLTAETDDIYLKNIDRWPPSHYLNIWLVNEITSLSMGSGIAGYATLPQPNNFATDGIVNEARWFGSSTDDSKVHIHEAGHYLGLYHTFEGACTNNNCLMDGDHVCDTPPDASTAPVVCNSTINTCTTDADDVSANNPFRPVGLGGLGDQPDMISNYMDYGFQTCQHGFTQGQSDRMNAVLNTDRSSLLQSLGCANPCGVTITGFSNPAQYITLNVGDNFIDTAFTQSGVAVSYEWSLGSTVVSTDTVVNYTFATAGSYTFNFKIYNTTLQCSSKKTVYVTVECPVQAVATMTTAVIDAGVPVNFFGAVTGGTSQQWVLDGVPVSTALNYTTTFPSQGKHYIYLVGDNGVCKDTSDILFVGVGECYTGAFNTWYFGYSNSISFNTGSPTNLPVGANIGSNGQASFLEGCATVSDRNGRMLFYTDGQRAYDSNDSLMTNNLLAGPSSANGALIVPFPNQNNKYYVFTVENLAGDSIYYPTGGGFSYSIIDMNLNNGLGAFTTLNTQLLARSTEQQAGAKHCNGHDMWVVAHGMYGAPGYVSNDFYSYLVTDNGIAAPVISTVGPTIQSPGSASWGSEGLMKISPKGNRIAITNIDIGIIQVADFDNNTGLISNLIDLTSASLKAPYGLEFSPDGNKLYVSNLFEMAYGPLLPNKVYQYDLSSNNISVIRNSLAPVITFSEAGHNGAMQLAPDGKVYGIHIGGTDALYCIENPDNIGQACNVNTKAVPLKSQSMFGLPNCISSSYDYGKPSISGPAIVCPSAQDVTYSMTCGDSTYWIYNGSNNITSSTPTTITLNFTNAGTDILIAARKTACYGTLYDTLMIHVGIPQVNLGPDTTICSTGIIQLDAGTGYTYYAWPDGSHSHYFTAHGPGTYAVYVEGIGGCNATDTIVVSSFPSTINLSLGPDINYACSHQTFTTLNAPAGNYTSYLWGTTDITGSVFISNINSSTAYVAFYIDTAVVYLQVTDSLGCTAIDYLLLSHGNDSLRDITLGNDTTLCPGQVITLNPSIHPGYQYLWQDGSTNSSFTAWLPGIYTLQYTNLCSVSFIDSITITATTTLPVALGNDTTICPFVPFTLQPVAATGNYLWQDGSSANSYLVTTPGLYWLAVSTATGCYGADSIFIDGCTGLTENNSIHDVYIYPNPAHDYLFVEHLGDAKQAIIKLVIRNVIGQQVMENTTSVHKTNISGLAAGLYTVEAFTTNGKWIGRFVKEK